MAWALQKGFKVSKPWGDSGAYDVGIEYRGRLLRIQVKSTSYRLGNGYLCGFRPNQEETICAGENRLLRGLHRPRRRMVHHPRLRRPQNQRLRPDAMSSAAQATGRL